MTRLSLQYQERQAIKALSSSLVEHFKFHGELLDLLLFVRDFLVNLEDHGFFQFVLERCVVHAFAEVGRLVGFFLKVLLLKLMLDQELGHFLKVELAITVQVCLLEFLLVLGLHFSGDLASLGTGCKVLFKADCATLISVDFHEDFVHSESRFDFFGRDRKSVVVMARPAQLLIELISEEVEVVGVLEDLFDSLIGVLTSNGSHAFDVSACSKDEVADQHHVVFLTVVVENRAHLFHGSALEALRNQAALEVSLDIPELSDVAILDLVQK
jgi:hypothetical protein